MKKINSIQLASMMSMNMISTFLGIGMYSIIKISSTDAYISLIIGSFLGFLLLLVFFKIYNYEPDLNIYEKNKKLFDKKSKIINIVLLLILLIIGTCSMFNLTSFITSQFLRDTPILFISISFSIIIILINIKGIEVLSRTCLILYIMCFILFFIEIIFLFPQFNISNLKPVLEFGIKKPIIGSIYNVLLNILPIFFILVIPKNSIVDKEKSKKTIIFFYFLSTIIKLILVIITIGTLGINLASLYQYPEYMVLKRINILNFIDRIENVLTIQWLYGLFFNISFIVYCICLIITKKINIKIKSIIVTFLIIFLTLFFKNTIFFNTFVFTVLPFISFILLFINILIFIKIVSHKKIT